MRHADFERVEFITTNSSGIDLILSFALRCGHDFQVDSLNLIRTPKYEVVLPDGERGVGVSLHSPNQEPGRAYLQEFNYSESEKVVRLRTDVRAFELDVSKVDEGELERMCEVIARMNFDGRFVLSGVEAAAPAPDGGLESTLRSALRGAERGRAQDQGQPPDEAQRLFYAAMDAATPERKLFLLRQSLEKDPENVEALLASLSFEDLTPEQHIPRLREIIAIAERRLGENTFKEFAGRFWEFVETRPYMRARRFLADALFDTGRRAEAITEWEGILQLNPCDNQAIRYWLVPAYLASGRLEDARRLLTTYAEEVPYSTLLAWCRVLERFLLDDAAGASEALAVARKSNPATEAYIKGHRDLPNEIPSMYAPGSREEAISFAARLHMAWQAHQQAMQWLLNQPKPRR